MIMYSSLCLNLFHLLAQKPKLKTKFFNNIHLSESSFTCPGLQASGLARRLMDSVRNSTVLQFP